MDTAIAATRAELRSDGPPQDAPDTWASRPILAFLLRAAVLGLPVIAAIGASIVVEHEVSRPAGWAQVWWWATTLLAAALAATLVERGVRKLTPLATLLRLTLVFPDRAPSRYKIARAAANPTRLAELADGGVDERSNAAGQVLALLAQLGRHDRLTRGHSERVRVFADLIGEEMGVTGPDREKLRWAALIHDIGKISVPAAVLNKKGRPDPAEWAQIQGHPEAGEAYAGPLIAWLGPWAGAITEHHERWDGTGYPRRLAGDALTLGGRIVAVADAYETMTAARSYKKPLSVAAARAELTACAGHQFDPDVVRAFLLVGVGRLSKALGPLSWLAHLPLTAYLQAFGTRVATGAVTATGPAAAVGVAGLAAAVTTFSGVVPAAAATHPQPPAGHTAHTGLKNPPRPAAQTTAPVIIKPSASSVTVSAHPPIPHRPLHEPHPTAPKVTKGPRTAAPVTTTATVIKAPRRPQVTPSAHQAPKPTRTTPAAPTVSPTAPAPMSQPTTVSPAAPPAAAPPAAAPASPTATTAPVAALPQPTSPDGKGKGNGKGDGKGKGNGNGNGNGKGNG